MDKLDAIFSPESVAILGASTTPGKVGHDIFQNILGGGYTGTLYPVNPKARSILCVKAYKSILDIPDSVDLAMIILPPKLALAAVEECVEKEVKGIIIVSAGFREVGGKGVEIEDKIIGICKNAGIRVVGPNCLGVINPNTGIRLNASFSARMPEAGNVSFISQSGALCTAVLDFAKDRGFGFSKFISIGNKADVDELDLLRYYHADPDTSVIMIYMEELRRSGQEFIDEVKKITSGPNPTPILVIKSGKTAAGASAAASHTGAIAGSEAIYDAIFDEAGIIRVESVNELFDYANAFSMKKLPRSNKIAIVTNAGGPGIVATDMTEVSGLQLAKLKQETLETLASHLPPTANINNPVDVIGDAAQDRYENALEAVIKDEGVSGVLVILTPQSMTNAIGTAEVIVRISERSDKPVVCCFMGIIDVSAGVTHLQKHRIPVYKFPENAAKALGVMYKRSQWLNRQILAQFTFDHNAQRAAQIIDDCLSRGINYLSELEGLEVLACYGFKVLPTALATTEGEAVDIAEKIGLPVVMKILSPQIIHKSDADGVKVNLQTGGQVREAFNAIVANAEAYDSNARIRGVLVQKMAPQGEEVILGMTRYPVFGPLVMFGLGGIYVELFKDVVFRIAPIGRNNARRMIRSIKGLPMLQGFRGRPVADLDILERMITGLSDLVLENPQIKELDINPLLVHGEGQGATVADVRIILEKKEG
ncbi:MAG: CoA-binding protein [Desulfobacteraceae bacterium]|nr:CoA-binding protein [Desulfobacteraceae bacterium]